jgi:hypothetical protein
LEGVWQGPYRLYNTMNEILTQLAASHHQRILEYQNIMRNKHTLSST